MTQCSTRLFPSGFGKPLLHLLGQSWPIALTSLNLAFFNFISLPFIGRLGKTEMAALGLASTSINVFGSAVLIGLFTASETLMSQAFGEKNYQKASIFCQQAVWVGLVATVPIMAIVINSGHFFQLLGQENDVINDAMNYIWIYLPAFPISVVYLALIKLLNCQCIVIPCALAGLVANAANVLFHYIFIVVLDIGLRGAAISVVLTSLLFTCLLLAYIRYRNLHRDVWHGFSSEALLSWSGYLKLAIRFGHLNLAWYVAHC